ncbi:MAG: hypothetical protein ACPLXO_03655 [Desulfurella sp.]|uniref:hypothetical protein n=1 Tax=Desulfurella sp. TaxID=1962857 RepID=UPI003C9EBAC1
MLKKIFLTVIIVFLPILASANVITSCINQIKEGNLEQAIALGKLAVVEHSNNPASYMCLAAAYAKDKHYNFAKVELEEALILTKSQNSKEAIDNLLNNVNSKLSNVFKKAPNADNQTKIKP